MVSCPVLENAAVRPMIAAPRDRPGVDNDIIPHLVKKLVAEGKVEKVPNEYAFQVHELVLVDKLKEKLCFAVHRPLRCQKDSCSWQIDDGNRSFRESESSS